MSLSKESVKQVVQKLFIIDSKLQSVGVALWNTEHEAVTEDLLQSTSGETVAGVTRMIESLICYVRNNSNGYSNFNIEKLTFHNNGSVVKVTWQKPAYGSAVEEFKFGS